MSIGVTGLFSEEQLGVARAILHLLDENGLEIRPKAKTPFVVQNIIEENANRPVSVNEAAQLIKAAGFEGWSRDSLLRWGKCWVDGKQVVPVRFNGKKPAQLIMSEFWAVEPELSERKRRWKALNSGKPKRGGSRRVRR